MIIAGKYLLFLGDVADRLHAKTAFGLVDWARERCAGQWRLPSCKVDLGLPDMDLATARKAGVQTLVIGVSPFGGEISEAWIAPIVSALNSGMSVASGMHTRLASIAEIAAAAAQSGASLFDVRETDRRFQIGTGRKRTGRRMLMVGTDCAVGKKYSALTIARAMAANGTNATFRATGQTGILIAGEGIPIDAIIGDFLSGAAESLSPDNADDHWDVIEGQGSLFHPAYAAVTLGLLHGSQPDAMVLCHDAGRSHIDGYPSYPLPDLEECIAVHLTMARITNPATRFVGMSINTSSLPETSRLSHLQSVADRIGLPCFDPLANGPGEMLDLVKRHFD
jgi:uncharacterized NAD-dependent epimerase/dehydratase family protein